jgi:hypothetical protein
MTFRTICWWICAVGFLAASQPLGAKAFAALSVALIVGLLPTSWGRAAWTRETITGLLAAVPAILVGAYLANVQLGGPPASNCVSCGSSKGACGCSGGGCGSSGCGASRRTTTTKATQPGGTRRLPAVMQPQLQAPGYPPGHSVATPGLPNPRVIALPRAIQNGPVTASATAAPAVVPAQPMLPSPPKQSQSPAVLPVTPVAAPPTPAPSPPSPAPAGSVVAPVKP